MSRFLMDRGIFENDLWQDPVSFRLFFYLVGKAAFKEGLKSGGILLQRGQFLRSYRKLQEDLSYVENRAIKTPSLSTIKRSVDKLVKQNRIKIEESELGTVFTVSNYQQYQGFPPKPSDELETQMERSGNADGTTAEQLPNNKNEGFNQGLNMQTNGNTPPTPPGDGEGQKRFEEFWEEYPKNRRLKKAAAEKIWKKRQLGRIADVIIASVGRYRLSDEWKKDGGRFVPHPTTFLNQDRWEDEVPEPAKKLFEPKKFSYSGEVDF